MFIVDNSLEKLWSQTILKTVDKDFTICQCYKVSYIGISSWCLYMEIKLNTLHETFCISVLLHTKLVGGFSEVLRIMSNRQLKEKLQVYWAIRSKTL